MCLTRVAGVSRRRRFGGPVDSIGTCLRWWKVWSMRSRVKVFVSGSNTSRQVSPASSPAAGFAREPLNSITPPAAVEEAHRSETDLSERISKSLTLEPSTLAGLKSSAFRVEAVAWHKNQSTESEAQHSLTHHNSLSRHSISYLSLLSPSLLTSHDVHLLFSLE